MTFFNVSSYFLARDCLDPKSNGADTVICIDTSSSMEGQPFQQSLEFINQFIDSKLIEPNIGINNKLKTFIDFQSQVCIKMLLNYYNKCDKIIK